MIKFIKLNYKKNYINLVFAILVVLLLLIIINLYERYKIKEFNKLEKFSSNFYFKKTVTNIIDQFDPRHEKIIHKVESGETFDKILDKLNIGKQEKNTILRELVLEKKVFKKLYAGQIIKFKVDKKSPSKITEIDISLTRTKNLIAKRSLDLQNFSINTIEKNLIKKISYNESRITNSLYSSAVNQGIPPNIIVEFARIYGFQIDFQRDIWKNDTYQIIYEKFLNEEGNTLDTGNIIYANLILQGKENPLYFFKDEIISDHFDERGQSIKKTLMKTPINGARLSSSFGKRKHPILGFTKMHTGTDFAAPTGTPIMASGDGKVIKASWCGGGGNCVKIKHNSTYTTVYAHMSKFARGIKKGKKVFQGQIIGYVGSTGMSTGPHLHYEVIVNGKKVNSQKLKLPSGKVLKGNARKEFEVTKIKTNVLKSELIFNDN